MTTWYSDHFGTDGVDDSSIDISVRPSAGVGHSRLYRKRCSISTLALQVVPDVMRLMTFHSNDRLFNLWVCSDGGSDAGAINIGLHLSGDNHDGAVIDADLFASALDISSAIDFVDEFDQATTVTNVDRGKNLWAIAAVGAASYTSDPNVQFDLTATVTTSFTTTNSILTFTADYTTGG